MNQALGQLLKALIENKGSDLHLTENARPALRLGGEITFLKTQVLKGNDIKGIIFSVLSSQQQEKFLENKELDFSFGVNGLGRFRGNVFFSKGNVGVVLRAIPQNIPSAEDLGLPPIMLEMTARSNGLILVTGPTGSGKSTTLAAMIDYLNTHEAGHIVTLEDPIEFVHQHKSCIVNQREVGSDTENFSRALKSLLRQDPDIVLIGELRDLETIESALTIAETGHLVFGTLHTNSCVQTIARVVNSVPAEKKDQIRTLLSFVLQGIMAQQLIPSKVNPKGRELALEILNPTGAIRNLIREDKMHQVYSAMQMGQDQTGMITMNQSLYRLFAAGKIEKSVAFTYSPYPEELEKMISQKKS